MTKPKTMRAMVLEQPGQSLKFMEVPVPKPSPDQVLIRVHHLRGLPHRPPRGGWGVAPP